VTDTAGVYLDATPPYVRGASGFTYEITAGITSIDRALRRLRTVDPEHPDLDTLLDARLKLTAKEIR